MRQVTVTTDARSTATVEVDGEVVGTVASSSVESFDAPSEDSVISVTFEDEDTGSTTESDSGGGSHDGEPG